MTFRHVLTGERWDSPQVSRSTLRFLGARELASFLYESGLTVVEQYGDWNGAPVTEDSPELIYVAVRSRS